MYTFGKYMNIGTYVQWINSYREYNRIGMYMHTVYVGIYRYIYMLYNYETV